jgi:hypothetical protein
MATPQQTLNPTSYLVPTDLIVMKLGLVKYKYQIKGQGV